MWKKIIHLVERIHHKKIPAGEFSYGMDYLTNETINSAHEYLLKYSQTVLESSDKFFAFTPPRFTFDGKLLSFPAPIIYPHQAAVNKISYAKVFLSVNSQKAVIVIPHWCAAEKSYLDLCLALSKLGFTAVRMTLPYHEERGEEGWEFNNDMVSANIGRTIQSVRQSVIEVRAVARWLKQTGHKRIGIVGGSIGSCVASIAQAHDQNINSLFANHMSSYFGDVVWLGVSTKHIRKSLEKNISQPDAHDYWEIISPMSYIKRVANTKPNHFIMIGKHDLTFPYHLSRQVMAEYKKYNVEAEFKTMPVGHFTLRYPPYSYYIFGLIVNHFRKTL
ncbi:MAG: prolyl oligopeptidase family serine peptidase [Candidatus Kerfeldbacteria bacterium]|nr:prolyl oligopeptidase family serine peptidase [Candidatus Kerfeldbacteria bacterium]